MDLDEMKEIFEGNLPDSLYLNHYELAEQFGSTPAEWKRFLKDNETFITQELTAIAEASARQALSRLSDPNVKVDSSTVSAVKTLLDRSEQLNRQNKDTTKLVMSFLPHPEMDEVLEFTIKVEGGIPMPAYVQDGYGLYTLIDDEGKPVFDREYFERDMKHNRVQIKNFTLKEWQDYVKQLRAEKNEELRREGKKLIYE